jgi:hypothetical protein
MSPPEVRGGHDVYTDDAITEDLGALLSDRRVVEAVAGVAATPDEGEANGADPAVEALVRAFLG